MKMFPVLVWVLCVALVVDFTTASTKESITSTTPTDAGETRTRSVGPTHDGVHLRPTAVSEMMVLPTTEKVVSTDSLGGKPVGWTNMSTLGAASTRLSPEGVQITTETSHYSTAKESASTFTVLTPSAPSATPSEKAPASSEVSSGTNISVFNHSSSGTTASGDVRSVSTPVMDSTSTTTKTSQTPSKPTIGGSSSQGSSYTFTSTSSHLTSSFSPSPAGIIIPDSKALPDLPIKSTSKSTITSKPVSIGGSSSAGSSYSLTSTDSLNITSTFSTSSAGIIIPDPAMKSTPKLTITTMQVSKGPTMTEVPPCSNRSVVNNCLIIIAALAVIATIFIICTIILCTKLSSRRYSIRRNPQSTEMMCISSLLPDRNPTYSRQRNPVRNGVLVIPGCGDSDEDGGDNFTLSSFLPDNDRYV